MLKDLGFQVPDINMKAYMKARAMTQEFIDDFLGYFMDPTNKCMSSLLLKCGLPGGMMGSMMADLKGVHSGINMILRSKNEPELSLDDLLVMLFDEVEYVWPKLGYPPLVTPFSQYVKNVALMNLMQQVKGEERWTMIDNHTWDMILGKSGRLPGTLAPEIIELAKSKGYEFVDTDPQLNYPDALDDYRKEMDENGWEYGEDDEELFELAMHDRQYRDYKSGVAKKRFEDELQHAKDASMAKSGYSEEDIKKLKRAKATVILDHHRKNKDMIKNPVLSYVEPYASSTCELVAEILQYVDSKPKLEPMEANAMYYGMLVDTDNFVNKTGVRTFEAAAYLKRNGADLTKVRKMSRESMETYRIRAKAISEAEILYGRFAIATLVGIGVDSPTVIGAQVANELLDIDGIEASFVLTGVHERVYISARSIDEVNVQKIMEEFGGGGHLTVAGAQLVDVSLEEAKNIIHETLRYLISKGEI
jgi:nanoRNase/pAp phosphatase (c-di-AMP/oligoRNAs hydrolase)